LKKNKNFKQKNKFILNKVCKDSLDDYTKLFHIKKGKTSFENRRTYLKAKWLGDEIVPRKFKEEYNKYPFSDITYNGKKLFKDADEFLNIDLMVFEEKIKLYVEYKNILIIPKKLDYTHLYVFNRYGVEEKNLDYYEIKHISKKDNEIQIIVIPPKNKKSLKIDFYEGILKQDNNKIILTFYNNHDYITAIFNTDLSNDLSDCLTGVAIGIADINKKIPVSKKVVLSKITIADMNELYLTLNESEMVFAKENYYPVKHSNADFKKSHLEKYIKKVNNLNKLFKNLSRTNYFNTFYEQLAFKEFSAVNNIFQKIKNNHSYYINSRRRILERLINSYHTQKYTEINMVMPVYQSDNVFEHQSKYALTIQNDFKKLSKEISINIIFVIKDCEKPFSQEFKIFLTQIQSSTNIFFVHRKDIEYEVNSIDFLYTDTNDYIVSKFLRLDSPVFYLFQDAQTIDEHQAIYRKILMRSVSYAEFLSDTDKMCFKSNPLLKNLSGKWYHYIYGSRQFWEDEVKIFENGKVEYYCEDRKTEVGEIIIKEYQSVILLDDPITKRLFTIVFDNDPYKIQKAFFTKNVAKQFETDLDIFSTGILSRKPIPVDKALEILGDVDDVRLLEKSIMSKKLADYLTDSYGYQHTHID